MAPDQQVADEPGGSAASPGAPRTRWARWLILGIVLVLIAVSSALASTSLRHEPAAPSPQTARSSRIAPPEPTATPTGADQQLAAVRDVLTRRSAAILRRDRPSFLATLDTADPAFRQRQAAVFDALEQVPLSSWRYDVGTSEQGVDPELDARFGAGRWWAPEVVLGYEIEGFDDRPTRSRQQLVFVRRGTAWLLAADDHDTADGGPPAKALWELGPVVAVRSDGVLALGRPDSRGLLEDVASRAAAAIPVVTGVWGDQWDQRAVVLVPGSSTELKQLVPGVELGQIAAVATAELAGNDGAPAGERILVNPDGFSQLGSLGRDVVVRHELTHVASRAATGPATSTWLAEGLADYVAYRDAGVPLSVAARELRADVRAGRTPTALPSSADFAGDNAELAQAYEQSWLAVRLLVRRLGQAGFLRLYRSIGQERDVGSATALERALVATGSSTRRFTAQWRADLQRRLG